MDSTTKASIGLKVDSRLKQSLQGDDGTYLFKEVIITSFWAAGQRCITEVGDDSVEVPKTGCDDRQVGTMVPFHIDGEVHRSVTYGSSRRLEVNNQSTKKVYFSSSQPNVIKPIQRPIIKLQSTTGASSEKSWQSTGSWSPSCDNTTRDSLFPLEACNLESICKAAVSKHR